MYVDCTAMSEQTVVIFWSSFKMFKALGWLSVKFFIVPYWKPLDRTKSKQKENTSQQSAGSFDWREPCNVCGDLSSIRCGSGSLLFTLTAFVFDFYLFLVDTRAECCFFMEMYSLVANVGFLLPLCLKAISFWALFSSLKDIFLLSLDMLFKMGLIFLNCFRIVCWKTILHFLRMFLRSAKYSSLHILQNYTACF